MSSFVQLSLYVGSPRPTPVPADVIDAIESVVISAETNRPSAFQITFRLSTRSPLHTIFLLTSGASPIPLLRVIIVVEVAGEKTVLMDGLTIDHSVAPGNEPGISTLTVRGEDLSAAMKYVTLTGLPYPAMSEYVRVNLILVKYALLGVAPMVIPQVFEDVPIPTQRIPTHRCTDYDYVTMLAQTAGYVFYIDPGPKVGMSTAYWGPEIRVGVPQPALSGNFDAHTNIETLSFQYNADKAALPVLFIQETHTGAPIPVPLPNVSVLKPPLGAVPPIPKRLTRLEGMAKQSIARALVMGLAEAADSMDAVTGTGSLDVRQYGRVLKARALVGVRGAGTAFNGLYYVQAVTHTIQRGSYKQNFRLVRSGLISTLPAVPV